MHQTRRVTRSSTLISQQVLVSKVSAASTAPPRKKRKIQETEVTIASSSAVRSEIPQGGATPVEDRNVSTQKKRKKRKSKANDDEPDTSQFLKRLDTPWKVGAHVSAAGGVEFAVVNAASIGANAFALFVKSQRKWTSPSLTEHSISTFKRRMQEYGYKSRHVVPHGSYLINLANPDDSKRLKSYECFLDDLQRCEALGLELYNFHPGSTLGATSLANGIANIASCINRAHKSTNNITILLENMAAAGNIIGGDFAHLASIIKLVDDKNRVGVCFDTCHAFAAGYDIRTTEGWNATSIFLPISSFFISLILLKVQKFSDIIGVTYLRAFHLNDSLCGLSSRKDRHQNIGLGELGISAFQNIMRDERTKAIPMVLETPSFEMPKDVWALEIASLGRMSLDRNLHSSETDIGVMTAEIRAAVAAAEARSGKTKGKKEKPNGNKKRKKKAQSDTEDGHPSCGDDET